jgi:hypothetical protein
MIVFNANSFSPSKKLICISQYDTVLYKMPATVSASPPLLTLFSAAFDTEQKLV